LESNLVAAEIEMLGLIAKINMFKIDTDADNVGQKKSDDDAAVPSGQDIALRMIPSIHDLTDEISSCAGCTKRRLRGATSRGVGMSLWPRV
jgi:hypothetical protein